MDEKCLLVDVSLYQPKMEWSILAENEVVGVIAKASSGSFRKDPLFLSHVEGARKAGLVVGAYHWCDPTNDDQAQAINFLNTVRGQPISFLAIDMEQYWMYWSEFFARKVTNTLPGSRISQNAYRVASFLKQNSDLPVIVYTRASFVMYWAPDAIHWLPRFHLWLAHYPYTRTRITTTWAELREKHLPILQHPMRPPKCENWLFWQFSGDKFRLNGTGGSLIDLNFFNGDKNDFHHFIKTGLPPEQAAEPELPRKARTLANLNVRRQPLVAANTRVGRLPWGTVVDVLEVRWIDMDKWARIGENQWVAMEYRGAILMIWV
jgi:lysozyme